MINRPAVPALQLACMERPEWYKEACERYASDEFINYLDKVGAAKVTKFFASEETRQRYQNEGLGVPEKDYWRQHPVIIPALSGKLQNHIWVHEVTENVSSTAVLSESSSASMVVMVVVWASVAIAVTIWGCRKYVHSKKSPVIGWTT